MGIRFYCPNGHKLNVKEFQAGRRGICPFCGARTQIPVQSTRPSSKLRTRRTSGQAASQTLLHDEGEDAQASDSSPDILPGEPPRLPGDPAGGKMLAPSAAPGNAAAESVVAPPAAPVVLSPGPIPAATPVFTGGPETSAPPRQVQAAPQEPLDPIAEAPDMIWYIRPPTGGQFGPAPGELMRTWMSEGRVSADSLVWREGWRDWQEAGTIFPKLCGNQLFDMLETAPSLPVVAAPAAHSALGPKPGPSSDRSQLALLIVSIVAVVVLVFVFIYMLFK